MPRPSCARIQRPDRASLGRTCPCIGRVASRRDIREDERRSIRSGHHPDCGFSSRRSSSETVRFGVLLAEQSTDAMTIFALASEQMESQRAAAGIASALPWRPSLWFMVFHEAFVMPCFDLL